METDGAQNKYKELQSKIVSLSNEMEKETGVTKEQLSQYAKLQSQIETANRQLASYQSQQDRAKNSLSYYTSGLADLQRGYETAQKSSQAYVNRLEAEGKQDEANQARMSGLNQSLSNLSSQYEKQESELQKIASTSGLTSEAYLKQKTRLDETGTAVAETRTKISELNSEMKESHSSFLSGVRSKLDSVNEKASKTSDLFWKITGAQYLANGITSALQSIQAHFSTLIDSAKEYDVDQQKLIATWTTLTGSTDKAKDMQDTINNLAIKTGQATDTVNELEQGFYHLHSSKTESDELTKSMLNMSDAVGLDSQQIQAVTQDMVNGLSRGKANAGMLNQISQYFPMFREQLAKYETQVNHGKTVTVADLTTMAKQGKISSQAIETVFNQLGSGKYDKAADNMLQTMYGMERTIKSRMPALLGEIYEPIMQMKNPLIGQISKWTTSEDTKKAFSGVGQALAMQISDIMTAFGSKKINISSNLDGLLLKLQTGIDKLGATIVAHKKDIKSFIDSFKTGSSVSLKIFVDVLKDMAVIMKPALDLMAKFPKTTASIITGGLLASKAITGMSLAFKGLDIVKKIGTLFGNFLNIVSFGKFAKIAQGIKDFAAATKGATLVEKAQLAIETIMNAMNPFAWVALGVTALTALTVGFTELYKHSAKFRTFVNNLVKSAQRFFKGITKWFGQTWSNIKKGASKSWKNTKKAFSDGWNSTVKATQSGYKSTTKWFGNLWSDTKKGVQNSWNDTRNKFSSGWNNTKKITQSGANWVGNRWNQLKNDTGKIANDMKNSNNSTFRNAYNTLNSYTQTWHDIMTGKWNKVGGDIKNTVNDLFKTVKSAFSGAYNWLNNLTGGRLGDILKTFNSIFGSITKVVQGAFKGIHNGFVDIVRGILKPFNTMLDGLRKGINWVLNKVGASTIKGTWSVPVPGYAQGTGGVLKDQLAMVNDGKGSNYREMYHTPDGQIGMFPAQRNMIVPLKAGTEILDGNNSARLASLMGLQKYASGSIGSFFSGILSGAKDIFDDVDSVLKNPIDFLKSVFNKFVGNISGAIGIGKDIITNFPSTVAKLGVSWVKKLFSDFAESANPSGSGVQRWKDDVIKALKMNGFQATDYQVKAWLKVIQRESNGNPHAINNWDSNARAGHPSKGLVQTIDSTFNAYKFKGHNSIFNGFDDLLAGINYMKHKYGSSNRAFARVSGREGYANGGIVSNEGLYTLAEGNKPEFIIPTDYTKHNRAVELLNQAKTAITGTGLSDDTSKKLDTLIEQNNALIELFKTMMSRKMDVNFNGNLVGELYPEIDKQGYSQSQYQQRNTWG
ncbi:tape measure protein [Liquorilactobacillus vini]|uniref:tape measure protein n=1 Tax=Liquorilactobacillus vini TaxID=238015 RepID=UPI000687B45D|nr:tape measure protein [Liquorilactobacillus vini]